MNRTALNGIAAMVMMAATTVSAACWNADEAGVSGPAVEICFEGSCEQTNMVLECAGGWGATIDYANGWAVNVEIMGSDVSRSVSLNDRLLTDQQLQTLTCRELDGEDGCRFPEITLASAHSNSDHPLDLIDQHFRNALGVDAENLQLWLLEAGLYHGPIDGQWGMRTEAAFMDALDWANSRGMQYDLRTEDGFYDFVLNIRSALFNIDSGLSRTPTGNEFLLVTASRRSMQEAEQVANQLDQQLTARGYPSRAYVLVATNGWYAVVAGMYSRSGCVSQADQFKNMGLIPSDSYCAGLDRFDPFNWTN